MDKCVHSWQLQGLAEVCRESEVGDRSIGAKVVGASFLFNLSGSRNPYSLATPCTSSATKINRQRADLRVSEHLRRESRGGRKPISPVVCWTSCGGGRRPAAAADAAQGGPQPSGACSDHRVGDGRGGSRVDVGGNGTRGEELLLGGRWSCSSVVGRLWDMRLAT